MLTTVLAISAGASAGAICRWLLNTALNSLFPAMPPGTLAANWAGSFLMGCAIFFFAAHPGLSQQWRLMAITGFLGSLTTFSAFSGEMAALISQCRYSLCAWAIFLHVAGSIGMVFLGMAAMAFLKKTFG